MIQSDDDDLISDEDVIAVFPCLDKNNIYEQTDTDTSYHVGLISDVTTQVLQIKKRNQESKWTSS